jgi:hypothetical protein
MRASTVRMLLGRSFSHQDVRVKLEENRRPQSTGHQFADDITLEVSAKVRNRVMSDHRRYPDAG